MKTVVQKGARSLAARENTELEYSVNWVGTDLRSGRWFRRRERERKNESQPGVREAIQAPFKSARNRRKKRTNRRQELSRGLVAPGVLIHPVGIKASVLRTLNPRKRAGKGGALSPFRSREPRKNKEAIIVAIVLSKPSFPCEWITLDCSRCIRSARSHEIRHCSITRLGQFLTGFFETSSIRCTLFIFYVEMEIGIWWFYGNWK